MKGSKTIITGLVVAASIALAAQGYAWMGGNGNRHCGPGGGPGAMMGTYTATANLSAEQRAQVQAIEAKYQDQITAKQDAILAKRTELQKALADDTTTVGEINRLRDELRTLHQDLWKIRTTVNQEIKDQVGIDTFGPMGPGFCRNWSGGPMARLDCDGTPGNCWQGAGYGPRGMMHR